MAITSNAEHFLNAFFALRNHDNAVHETQRQRAIEHNKAHPEKQVDAIGNQTDKFTGVADFVCLAFSLELYLKAIFEALGQSFPKKHEVKALFDALPNESREQIFSIHMKKVYDANWEDYYNQIGIINKGFQEFRYSFEHKELSYHCNFSIGMIRAIEKHISDLRELKSKT